MFELISGGPRHPFHDNTIAPTIVSIAAHIVIIGGVVILPLMYATGNLPEVPTMMAFATAAPPPPAPPPPPPAARAAAAETPAAAPTTGLFGAPIEAPSQIQPEPAGTVAAAGVPGGVEGGIEGGVPGGIVGGLDALAPPPPPLPPPPPAPKRAEVVRIGGNIQAPALLFKPDPFYPPLAAAAKVGGIVILEARVGEDGCVESVTVLRSIAMLDRAAIDAVKQWRYSPLVLNGVPTPFVLTVTLTFRAR